MKVPVVILILALCGLGSLAMTSCFVTRRSPGYACSTDDDCTEDRTCDRGYCVQRSCPGQCSSCDLIAKTCDIECSSNKPCAAVQCPAGYDCTIRCSNAGACGEVDCSQGTACEISCSGGASCQDVRCGAAACTIACSGPSGCGTIDCASSCSCDVNCNTPNACPSISCPQYSGGSCATDPMGNAPCDSTVDPTCGRCL